jgi:hypothetical protein
MKRMLKHLAMGLGAARCSALAALAALQVTDDGVRVVTLIARRSAS